MDKIKFSMNVYYNANEINKKNTNVQEDVLNRMGENDCQDLYNGIEQIEDKDVYDILGNFIENSTIEQLKQVVSIDEDSLRFDETETYECDYGWLAYLVDVTFDIEKVLMQIKE